MADDERIIDSKHNNPPPDIKIGDALREELRDSHIALCKRRDELLDMGNRFDADHAAVEDDETSGLLAGIIVQINSHVKVSDKTREGIKAPYLDGGRIVDGFFNGGIQAPLEKIATALNAKQTAFARAKAARIKREAEEAEAKARAEEDARRREAERAEREQRAAERAARKVDEDNAEAKAESDRRIKEANDKAEAARQAEEKARVDRENAARTATSNAADRSRVRGSVAMSSLQTTWKFRVLDITKVPVQYLMVNEPVINASIRGKAGLRDIPGLEIYPHEESRNR